MGKRSSIGVLVAALLMSGLLVGVSHGRSSAITEPHVISLHGGKALRAAETERMDQLRESALGPGGIRVGTIRWNCVQMTDWHCTIVYGLKASAQTEPGTIVAMGIFRGFNGESLAVTGGTKAYENVRGSVKLAVEDGLFVHTLDLIP